MSYEASFDKAEIPPTDSLPVWNQELEVLYQTVTPSIAFEQLYDDQENDDYAINNHYAKCSWAETFSHLWHTSECSAYKKWKARTVTRYTRGLGWYLARCRYYFFNDDHLDEMQAIYMPDKLAHLPKASSILDDYPAPLSSTFLLA